MALPLLLFCLLAFVVNLPKSCVAAVPISKVQLAVTGLKAVQEIGNIMDPDVFEKTSNTKFDGLVRKVLDCIVPFIFLLDNPKSDMNDFLLLRVQFREDHIKLDNAHVSIDDIKGDPTWKSTFHAKYVSILANNQRFENYINLPNASRKLQKALLLEKLEEKLFAPLDLYNAISEMKFDNKNSLSALAMHVTRNHRRKVMSILLAVSRVVIRGAELSIANEMMKYGLSSTTQFTTDWLKRLKKMTISMREVDNALKELWHKQMKEDVLLAIRELGSLSSKEFSAHLYDQLSEKFYWRNWLVLIYKEKGQKISQSNVWQCGGVFHLTGLLHGRHLVVASSEIGKSLFSVKHASQILDTSERSGPETDVAFTWWRHVADRFGTSCQTAAFIGAICWSGCDPVWVAQPDRMAYKRMSVGKYSMNFVVFG